MSEKTFISDNTKIMEIEINDKEIIKLIEIMLEKPFNIIATQNIYFFLQENYGEIKISGVLTKPEEEILDEINSNLDEILEGYDLIVEEMRYESLKNYEKEQKETEGEVADANKV